MLEEIWIVIALLASEREWPITQSTQKRHKKPHDESEGRDMTSHRSFDPIYLSLIGHGRATKIIVY